MKGVVVKNNKVVSCSVASSTTEGMYQLDLKEKRGFLIFINVVGRVV